MSITLDDSIVVVFSDNVIHKMNNYRLNSFVKDLLNGRPVKSG